MGLGPTETSYPNGASASLRDPDRNAAQVPPLPPQGQNKASSAGFWSGTIQKLRAPEKSPPTPAAGAAALVTASDLQKQPPFQPLAFPFAGDGATNDATAGAAPGQPMPQPKSAARTTAAPADALPDADKRAIDRWLADHDPASAQEVVDQLRSWSKPGQQYLIDHAFNLDKQLPRNLIPFARVGDLVRQVQGLKRDDHALRHVVAERLMICAARSQRLPKGDGTLDDPHHQARACAVHALDAMEGDDEGLVELLLALAPETPEANAGKGDAPQQSPPKKDGPPNDAVMFAEALRNGTSLDSVALSEKRNQVLAAVNGLARTAVKSPAVTAIVYGLWDEITPEDLQRSSRLTRNLAVAVANQWDPYNPPVERVEGLLTSPGWVNLMCTGSFEWLAAVHEGVRHLDPWLTVAMLASHGATPRSPPRWQPS